MAVVKQAVAGMGLAAQRSLARRDHPMATHLVFFAIGILVPVLAIVGWMLFNTARVQRNDEMRDATTLVQHLNATIEIEIGRAIAVGQTLATSRMIADGDFAAFDRQARTVAHQLGLLIAVRDLTGQQRVNTGVPVGTPLPVSNESVLASDRLADKRREPVISNLITGTLTRVPLVLADVPVTRDTGVIANISIAMFPGRLSEILSQGLPAGWIAGLVDRDGRLIARSRDQQRFVGTVHEEFITAATEPDGLWQGVTREGEPVAGAYVRSPLSGWVVSVAVPEAILRAPQKLAMLSLLGLVAVSLAGSCYLGWRLSRRVSAPIRDLVDRARELGEGRRPAAQRSGVTEVNDVTDALLAASVELDRRTEAARRAADAVRANEERLHLVQETAGIGTADWDIESSRVVCSPRFYQLFSLPADSGAPDRRPADSMATFAAVMARVHAAERARIKQAYKRLLHEGGPFDEEFRIQTPSDGERWIHATGRLDVADGKPVRMLSAIIDVTDRKRGEEHLRFLLREVSHRSKNLLAVIQAMATQTAKSAESVADFRRRFGERLMGLAASHDLLVNQNWTGASVEQLVRGQLAPFVDAQDNRLSIHGPTVDLRSEAAEALGLALHELASNSLRHGALSDLAGKVEIIWRVLGGADQDGANPRQKDRRFHMEWNEVAASPVSPPDHRGFGRIVIEQTVRATLRGTVTLAFPPSGMRWCIDAPDSCLASSGQSMAA